MRWASPLCLPQARRGIARRSEPATPLFASDEPIRLTITGPVSAIARGAEDPIGPRDGDAHACWRTQPKPTRSACRRAGITRRQERNLQFPPLRVEFAGRRRPPFAVRGPEPAEAGHALPVARRDSSSICCSNMPPIACSIVLTPTSFRVRLATVDYVEDGRQAVDLAARLLHRGPRRRRPPQRAWPRHASATGFRSAQLEPRATPRASPSSNI